jgi:oxygen-independent coproporphyrinogen III oxidase
MPRLLGCYVHIPFCVKKCAYCDFNSYSGYGESLMRRYVEALTIEIERAEPPDRDEVVDTVFFGGGTPTAIPAADEASILRAVIECLGVAPGAEITTEANPGTADIAGLETLRAAGFNRISFGVQSFDKGLLLAIDRIHSADEAKVAVRAARAAGFDNISIDLMFGLPGQTMAQWQDTIDQALELDTDHLSMYALIVEEGTGFGTMARKGRLFLPEDDLIADMYSAAIERTAAAGYEQYEISNFARPGYECRHNLHYWRGDDYYGFGAGAVGNRKGIRRTNILLPAKYCEAMRAQSPLSEVEEALTDAEWRGEAMMLGLRLTRDGVDVVRFTERFHDSPQSLWPAEIRRFTELGLLDGGDQDRRLRLTARGVFLGNEVMAGFI